MVERFGGFVVNLGNPLFKRNVMINLLSQYDGVDKEADQVLY